MPVRRETRNGDRPRTDQGGINVRGGGGGQGNSRYGGRAPSFDRSH